MRLPVLAAALGIGPAAHAFCTGGGDCQDHGHEAITHSLDFLRSGMVSEMLEEDLNQDQGSNTDDERRHFDNCRFEEASDFIRHQYDRTLADLDPADPDPFAAAYEFGALLHPIQDFYAHSNWAELLEVTQGPGYVDPAFLLDGGTGPFSDLVGLSPLLDDIVVGELPETGLPAGDSATLAADSAIPVLTTADGHFHRMLVTGWRPDGRCPDVREGLTMDEYAPYSPRTTRLVHGNQGPEPLYYVNPCDTDFPTSVCLHKDRPGRPYHEEAFTLASWQTQAEWCRLLHLAADGDLDRSSLLMTLWADPALPPHPDATACATATPGLLQIQVTVEDLTVRHRAAGTSGYVVSLYTDDFAQSDAREFSGGAGDPTTLPEPVSLCVDPTDTPVATVWGWDDGPQATGFTDDDPVLRGVTIPLDPNAPETVYRRSSEDLDLAVHVRKDATDADADGLPICVEAWYGTSDDDEDTDDDGLWDDTEVDLGLDPLDRDTDRDGLFDYQELVLFGTDPLDPDTDGDGVPDGIEVADGTDPTDIDSDDDNVSDYVESGLGSNALDPDTDDDGLTDGQEVAWGTGLLDPDTDDDRLLDGRDTDWIAPLIVALPDSAFLDPRRASTTRTSLVTTLGSAQSSIARGATASALTSLDSVSAAIPGCATTSAVRAPVCDALATVRANVSR